MFLFQSTTSFNGSMPHAIVVNFAVEEFESMQIKKLDENVYLLCIDFTNTQVSELHSTEEATKARAKMILEALNLDVSILSDLRITE